MHFVLGRLSGDGKANYRAVLAVGGLQVLIFGTQVLRQRHIAEPSAAGDALRRPLVPRFRFRARLSASVRRYRHNSAGESEKILEYCSYV
jgi:hypothetical protein